MSCGKPPLGTFGINAAELRKNSCVIPPFGETENELKLPGHHWCLEWSLRTPAWVCFSAAAEGDCIHVLGSKPFFGTVEKNSFCT